MGLLDQISNLEETEDIEKCCKCEEYREGFDGPFCMWHHCECSPNDWCDAFEFADFWKTKRGY